MERRKPEVTLEAEAANSDARANVYTMNVELGGLFVPTEQDIPEGAVITLNIKGGGGLPDMRAIARVTQRLNPIEAQRKGRKAGVKLEFLDLRERLGERVSKSDPPPAARPRRRSAPGTPARVLVVDDDALLRKTTAALMEQAGHEVITARNGSEALSTALSEEVDLILTDVTMPTMDGWQLLRLIRSRPKLKRTPVIFLTRLTNDSERLKAYELGVDDFLDKPFDEGDLLQRVDTLLARRRSEIPPDAPEALAGDLSQVALGSLLSLLEMERRTGILNLQNGRDSAVMHIRQGQVVRIDLSPHFESKRGIQRFFHVLDWVRGSFELTAVDVTSEDKLQLRISMVLMEHARLRDEAAAAV